MDTEIINRFIRLEDKLDDIFSKMDLLIRLDVQQKTQSDSIKSIGKRVGDQEQKLAAFDRSNWKHQAMSNFIERAFWITFTVGVGCFVWMFKV